VKRIGGEFEKGDERVGKKRGSEKLMASGSKSGKVGLAQKREARSNLMLGG